MTIHYTIEKEEKRGNSTEVKREDERGKRNKFEGNIMGKVISQTRTREKETKKEAEDKSREERIKDRKREKG